MFQGTQRNFLYIQEKLMKPNRVIRGWRPFIQLKRVNEVQMQRSCTQSDWGKSL